MEVDRDRRALSSTGDTDRLVTVFAGVAAGFLGIATVVKGVAAGDMNEVMTALGPSLAALTAFVMVRQRRHYPYPVLALVVVATAVSFKIYGDEYSDPYLIGLGLVTVAGILVVPRTWRWLHVLGGGLFLLTAKAFWDGITSESVWTGVAGAVVGITVMTLSAKFRDDAIALDQRYQVLVERLPVPLIQQDWSMVRDWLDECRSAGVADIEAHMESHPAELERILRAIKVRGVNPAIVGLVGSDGLDRALEEKMTYGITHQSMAPFVCQELIGLWNGRDPVPQDHVMRRSNGTEFWARLESANIDDESISGVDRIIVATDVTELKTTQAELGQQLRSKDEFIAAVSHELRTPLTSVLGFAELMMSDCDNLTPAQVEMLGHLAGEANDMAYIVEDLLVAARAEVGSVVLKIDEVDLAPIVDQVATGLESSFSIDGPDRLLVRGDRTRIAQVLRNLLTNAHRYGGEQKSVSLFANETSAVVEVRDNGAGVPIEESDSVFEPYVRAHDRPGMAASVGLGLAVSRQLAELMDGSVVYAREDGHTIFRMSIPLAAVDART